MPTLLALDATIVQQARPFGFSDFLNPAYLHLGTHVIPVKEDFSNLVHVVQEMRADPMRMQHVNAAASNLVHQRLTDHACLCAVRPLRYGAWPRVASRRCWRALACPTLDCSQQ